MLNTAAPVQQQQLACIVWTGGAAAPVVYVDQAPGSVKACSRPQNPRPRTEALYQDARGLTIEPVLLVEGPQPRRGALLGWALGLLHRDQRGVHQEPLEAFLSDLQQAPPSEGTVAAATRRRCHSSPPRWLSTRCRHKLSSQPHAQVAACFQPSVISERLLALQASLTGRHQAVTLSGGSWCWASWYRRYRSNSCATSSGPLRTSLTSSCLGLPDPESRLVLPPAWHSAASSAAAAAGGARGGDLRCPCTRSAWAGLPAGSPGAVCCACCCC